MVGSIERVVGGLVQLLKANSSLNTNLLNQRVTPAGTVESSMFPRITVSLDTPKDKLAGIGITAAAPTWKLFSAKLMIKDKDPKGCDKIANIVEDIIGANRNYAPATIVTYDQTNKASTVTANGYFFLMMTSGGTATVVVKPNQQYRRIMLVTGRWMQTG